MAIVWGNKTYSEKSKAFVQICSCCGELVVADQMIVKKSWHIYFLYYKTKEIDKWGRCRVCGFPEEFPSNVQPIEINNSQIIGTEELLKRSNPTVSINNLCNTNIFQKNHAILSNINQLAEVQNQNFDVEGNIQGLVTIHIILSTILLGYIWASSTIEQKGIGFFLAGVLISIVSFYIHKICKYLQIKGIHKNIGNTLTNFLTHTKQNINDLIDYNSNNKVLFKNATNYIFWYKKRIHKY